MISSMNVLTYVTSFLLAASLIPLDSQPYNQSDIGMHECLSPDGSGSFVECQNIYSLWLWPINPQSRFPAGAAFDLGVKKMAELINREQKLLPGYRLVAVSMDDTNNQLVAYERTLADLLDEGHKKWVSIGSTLKTAGKAHHQLSWPFKVPMITAADDMTVSPTTYPNQINHWWSYQNGALAVMLALKALKLDTIAVATETFKDPQEEVLDLISKQAADIGMLVSVKASVNTGLDVIGAKSNIDVDRALESFWDLFMRSNSKIAYMLFTKKEFLQNFLCRAFKAGRSGLILVVPHDMNPVFYKGDPTEPHRRNCTDENLLHVADFIQTGNPPGFFSEVDPDDNIRLGCFPSDTTLDYARSKNATAKRFLEQMQYIRVKEPAIFPFINTRVPGYTSAMMCHLALMIRDMFDEGVSLQQMLQHDSAELYERQFNSLRNKRFNGAWGIVSFENSSLRSWPLAVSVEQAGRWVVFADYAVDDRAVVFRDGMTPVWRDGSIGWHNRPNATYSDCLPGYVIKGSTCQKCERGKFFGSLDGMHACIKCPLGKHQRLQGQVRCTHCAEGSFTPTLGSVNCISCGVGRFLAEGEIARCVDCPKGRANSNAGKLSCHACAIGWYASSQGKSQCQRCHGARTTTMTSVVVDGQPQWVHRDGAEDESWCGCEKQTRTNSAGSCVDCQEGLDCIGMGQFIVKSGYAAESMNNGEPSIFKCHGLELRCTGGPPGDTCAEGREGVSCAQCMQMRTPSSDGTCAVCGESDTIPFALTCLGAAALLMLMYYLVHTVDKAKQSPWLLLCGMSGSIMLTCMQQLSLVQTIAIHWPPSMIRVLDIIRILAIDFEILRLSCVASASSLEMLLLKIGIIGVGIVGVVCIHLGIVSIFHQGRFLEHTPSLVGALGAFAMIFYISVTSTVLEPLQCLPNPNGKMTVATYQAVVCWLSGEHRMMVAVGFLGLLVPLLYLVHCAVVVRQFPRKMIRGDIRFLRMYMFLFFRYRTEMYWYAPVHMFRSLLLSIAPIIPNPVGQVMAMQFLTMAHLIGAIYLAPWRVPHANLLEALVTAMMLFVLSIACLLVEEVPTFEIVLLTLIFVCTIAIAVPLMMSYALLTYLFQRRIKSFDYFLCHHKAATGCFARLLRMHLRDINRTVFLDSDNLSDLDSLFDYVGGDTENLLVLCSRDILTRPWCVGEIVTAMLHHVKTFRVALTEFVEPTDEFIQQYDVHVSDLSVLSSRGINISMIQEGIKWLLARKEFRLPPFATQNTMESLVVHIRGLDAKDETGSTRLVSLMQDGFPTDVKVIILLDHSNFEINACALVLMKLLLPHFVTRPELTPHIFPKDRMALPVTVEVSIIMCTNGAFQQSYLLRLLRILAERPQGCHHIPIVAEENFRFPTKQSLQENQSMASIINDSDDEDAMRSVVLDVFKTIALDFQPERTEEVLRTQAAEVAKRMMAFGALSCTRNLTARQTMSKSKRQSKAYEIRDRLDNGDTLLSL